MLLAPVEKIKNSIPKDVIEMYS